MALVLWVLTVALAWYLGRDYGRDEAYVTSSTTNTTHGYRLCPVRPVVFPTAGELETLARKEVPE